MATLNPNRAASIWRELVSENPMTIEVKRFRRRFFEGSRSKGLNTTILVLALLAYASLLVVVSNMAGSMPPSYIIFVQTGALVLIAPTLMFSAVSGEREKRTWDLLLAAPISHAQIIVGKFIAGLSGLGALFVLFLIPTLFTSLMFDHDTRLDMMTGGKAAAPVMSNSLAFFNEEFVSVTFAILVLAASLLFSARCRRSLMSLSVVLVSLFVGLLAWPALAFSFDNYSAANPFLDLTWFFHPFMAIEKIEEVQMSRAIGGSPFDIVAPAWFGPLQGILYLSLAAVFVVWAFKTVNFADGEKKFMPRSPNA